MNPSPKIESRTADIAVIGMAGRFPGARDIEQYWENLCNGAESIRSYSEAELRAAGVSEALLANPNYVKAGAPLADLDAFDAAFFGINPKDAGIMDPQHRQFLECAWEGLEHAGHTAEGFQGMIGVFAGCGPNSYLLHNLFTTNNLIETEGLFALRHTGNDKDLLATRVSYQLNLHGPSLSVQTACSSSLVAVHVACQSLLNFECDLALAGAVSIEIPHGTGYLYRDGEVLSRDGKCRAFDAESSGTVFGSGLGIVVLRRLEDAIAAGDTIHAVIKGSAINNDGARKVGYLAPSVDGQIDVIEAALAAAQVPTESIDYIEAHGTGTRVGDPIEITALGEVFAGRGRPLFVGAVKTNIGHLDTASGVAGLIKTTLALGRGRIPPTLHFASPNPLIDFEKASIQFVNRAIDWPRTGHPRRAGVTSLGIGGTNAHIILEQAPELAEPETRRGLHLLTLSARSAAALDTATHNLGRYLDRNQELCLDDVAYTLHVGRRQFPHRRTILCRNLPEAVQSINAVDPAWVASGEVQEPALPITFLFPGQGSQYVGMGRELYETEPVFREWIDRCAETAGKHLGFDLRQVLYPAPDLAESSSESIRQTWNTQPILFAVEYSLAQLWMSWGVHPASMLGHSIGEYVAACLAGVFSFEDAIELVSIRGRLMREVPAGAMLAIGRGETEIAGFLNGNLSLATVNGPDQCVVAGTASAIDSFERELTTRGIASSRLQTSHAFHSHMMDPVLEPFLQAVKRIKLSAPAIPILSNVTGAWMTSAEATDPQYWVKQLRRTVRFHEALEVLLGGSVLLEVGPGATLAALARQRTNGNASRKVFCSLPRQTESTSDGMVVYSTLGALWACGAPVDWRCFHAHERRRRIPLPAYPFEKHRFWIGPKGGLDTPSVSPRSPEDWFYRFAWRKTAPPAAAAHKGPWLLFTGSQAIGEKVAQDLRSKGADVTTVRIGPSFARTGPGSFIVNPSSSGDVETLVEELAERQIPGKILWLWPIEDASSSKASLELCFHSLISVVQRLMARVPEQRIDVGLVSTRSVSVHGELVLNPEGATLAGVCRVAPQEYARLRCIHIDVDQTGPVALGQALVTEMSGDLRDAAIAYREGIRWTQNLEPCRLEPGTSRLRKQGVYLITGGLGGLGLAVAEWLARVYQARLVLVSRDAESRVHEYRTELESLERAGGEVLVCSCDVTDPESLRQALALARERFGSIQGVIHAAGVLDDGIIQLKSPSTALRVLKPKVEGARVLADVLRDTPLDFLALFSSISSIAPPAGQVDYCAANAYLNAFAQSRPASENVIAIGWAGWSETGMAVRADQKHGTALAASHPLLERLELDTDSELVYSGSLSVERHWVLSEHRFRGGDSLLPGTAHLELAVETVRRTIGDQPVTLENFTFLEPFRVSPDRAHQFRVKLHRLESGFEFSTARRDTTFAAGRVHPATPRELKIDLHAIARRCQDEEDASPRNVRQEQHFDFGPRWRNLRHIAFGKGECLATLELDPAFRGEVENYSLHPALLDMATGAALFLLPGYDRSGELFLPFSYKRATLYRRLPSRVYSHARIRTSFSLDLSAFDITIAAEDGSVLMDIEEFVVKRVSDVRALTTHRVLEAEALSPAPKQPPPSRERERIPTRQGIQVLQRILESRLSQVIFVSPSDPRPRIEQRPPEAAPSINNLNRQDDTESALRKMWQRVLGLDSVAADADFFAVGGHSLAALRLFTEIRKHFDLDLGLATIFEARTLRALAALIDGKRANRKVPPPAAFECLVPIQPGGSKWPLFCLHGVGGNVLNYHELAQSLGGDQPVYGVQSLALAGRIPGSVEQMASHYIEEIRRLQPEGPYFLCGLSFGGLLAYEIGRQLQAQGQRVGLVALIDTFQKKLAPGKGLGSFLLRKLHSYGNRVKFHCRTIVFGPDRLNILKKRAKTGKRKVNAILFRLKHRRVEEPSHELPSILRNLNQANYLAAANYRPGTYHGRVVLFRCKIRGAGDHPEFEMGWKHLVRGSLEVFEVPGAHLSIMSNPSVAALARDLATCLEKGLADLPAASPVLPGGTAAGSALGAPLGSPGAVGTVQMTSQGSDRRIAE